jgi:hypothetical protein
MNDTAIDAAVERVVKSSSDRQALTEAVQALAGEIGYGLVPKAAEPVVHRYFGGHWNFGIWVAACGQPDPSHGVNHSGDEITCPGCLASLDDGAGYETDADPKPQHGDHGTCATCGGEIEYWEHSRWNGVEDGVLDGQWSHHIHPADGHDAVIGGAA